MDATQPKINRKLVQRSAVLAVAAAVLLAVYVWLTGQNKDVDLGSVHSAGWIAALQLQRDGGSRLVVIKPDGSIVPCPGYKSGSTDREFAWRPDGNRIFFSSDRQDKTYNIFRWNLATGQVERRTLGKIAKSDPSFPVGDPGASHPLIVFSGEAWDLDPGSGKASQVFPIPPDKHKEVDTRDESSGERLGAFGLGAQQKVRTARYLKGKTYVVVIRRTDEGEMLVLQRLIPPEGKSPDEVKRDMQSYVVAAGDRIVIDVNPRTGT
ncbi:MAG: PD40 domain-containing protein, partial [Fimbriimonas ginsengisoli]|nr:PD40 domain-containing protein [Fimbriimonas ginsengisoli]